MELDIQKLTNGLDAKGRAALAQALELVNRVQKSRGAGGQPARPAAKPAAKAEGTAIQQLFTVAQQLVERNEADSILSAVEGMIGDPRSKELLDAAMKESPELALLLKPYFDNQQAKSAATQKGKPMTKMEQVYELADSMVASGAAPTRAQAISKMAQSGEHDDLLLRAGREDLPAASPVVEKRQIANPAWDRIEKAAQSLLSTGKARTMAEAIAKAAESDETAYLAYCAIQEARRG